MSFHASAEENSVRLEGSTLIASLRNEAGEYVESHIELDDIIGNVDGTLEWDGSGFFGTAEDVTFSFEGVDNVPILRARVRNVEGEFQDADKNLSERVQNINGEFQFI